MEDYANFSNIQLLIQKFLHPEHQVLIDSILEERVKEREERTLERERAHQLQLGQLNKASPSGKFY